jgi:hypothetical protein
MKKAARVDFMKLGNKLSEKKKFYYVSGKEITKSCSKGKTVFFLPSPSPCRPRTFKSSLHLLFGRESDGEGGVVDEGSYDLNLPVVCPHLAPPASFRASFCLSFPKPPLALLGKGFLFDEDAAPTEDRSTIDARASQGS